MGIFKRFFKQKPELDTPEPEVTAPPKEERPVAADVTGAAHLRQIDLRVQQAVESILDNEALTQELDDEAGRALISWGTAWAELLARSGERSVEPDLDEATAQRLRAVRKMMRMVSKWAASQANLDHDGRLEALKEIMEQAEQSQGISTSFHEAEMEMWAQRLAELAGQPEQAVNELRQVIEKKIFPI